jgi:hypothetical protein
MGKIEDMAFGLGNIVQNLTENTAEVIQFYKKEMADRVRAQLFNGTGGDGNPLHPTYSEDPFFKSRQSMEGYIAWKTAASGVGVPSNGSPNMFINGTFHSSIEFVDCPGGVEVTSDYKDAEAIFEKWGRDGFVPDDEYLEQEIAPVAEERIETIIRQRIEI